MTAQAFGYIIAALMVGAGGLWALQGLGYLDGTFTNSNTWSLIGAVLAGLGVALAISIAQRR